MYIAIIIVFVLSELSVVFLCIVMCIVYLIWYIYLIVVTYYMPKLLCRPRIKPFTRYVLCRNNEFEIQL